MEIIERYILPDGTNIQLEDWREHNTKEYPTVYGLTIGAYPKSKHTGRWGWVREQDTFRLSIAANNYANYSDENVKADYEALKAGTKKLEDLSTHFWNGEKDMWYLGMDVEYKGW